jgi:hypothetical protein
MIHVENVYEEILHQLLLDETLKGKVGLPGPGENSPQRVAALGRDSGR